MCYGQGFFSPNLVAIEQKNKNKQTLLQGYHHFHWNRELHEFPKSSPPPPPPSYNIDVAQKICISRTISLHNIIIQIFRHPQISPSLMKKIHTPQFHHPPPFQNKTTTTKKKYLPKPLYLVPIYSLISHLQPFTSNIHTKVKVIYVLLALLPTTLHNMRRKKNKKKNLFFYSYYPSLCGLTGQ